MTVLKLVFFSLLVYIPKLLVGHMAVTLFHYDEATASLQFVFSRSFLMFHVCLFYILPALTSTIFPAVELADYSNVSCFGPFYSVTQPMLLYNG
jgi:hypothetical protein